MFNLSPPTDDGLYISEAGEWSSDKHHFLTRYIDAFTTAMRDKGWGGLHYIDLFAGPGVVRLKNTNKLEWGSPLIAAQAPYSFSKLHLCESDKKAFDALDLRVKKFRPDSQILYGDANVMINEIIKQIPSGALSLAFIDPYGLHLEYRTLSVLARKRADLIIFFPDHLDALRNWETYYFNNPDSNLDKCFGQGLDWRSLMNEAPPHKRAQVLRELYEQQIRKLGYTEFESERISIQGRPLYCLIFCSKHKMGGKIWRNISGKKPNGQRTFDFE